MKILFITRKFPPSVGGMELFAHDISQELSKSNDLALVKWGGSRKWYPVILPYLSLWSFYELLKGDINIIHIQDSLFSPLGLILSRLFAKPYVVVSHGLDLTWDNYLYQKVIPYCVKRANAIFCISQEVCDIATESGVAPEKIHSIPLGIKDDIYGQYSREEGREILEVKSSSKIILSVGRLVERKGVRIFIRDVLPLLIKKHKDLLFIIIGEGEERKNIEKEIIKQNLSGHVRLMGQVEDYVRIAAYNASDVFVMPNIVVKNDIEGFGLVVLEASLCKLPVVASSIGGIRDAITNNSNGILIEPGQIDEFYKTVDGFLSGPAEAQRFGEQSRKFTLENYSWDKVAKKYMEVYKQLIKN